MTSESTLGLHLRQNDASAVTGKMTRQTYISVYNNFSAAIKLTVKNIVYAYRQDVHISTSSKQHNAVQHTNNIETFQLTCCQTCNEIITFLAV